jgi:hypothetical protein
MYMIPDRPCIVQFINEVVIKGIFIEILYHTSDNSDQTGEYIILLHPCPHRPDRPDELYLYGYSVECIIGYRVINRFSLNERIELQTRIRLRERRNIQRGLTGKVSYDIGRLIASYV